MQIGVVFPQTEIGADAGAVRAYGTRVQELGFTHIVAYDHVVGADPAVHKGWDGPYDVRTTFHEPLVLFGYLAALTSLELVTGIIILPQRQTALVVSDWGGTPSNTRPWGRISPIGGSASTIRSSSYGGSGRNQASLTKAAASG
jgi:hypothetical protein